MPSSEQRLTDLKARQEADERMLCPRCGKHDLRMPIHTNALSRHCALYVCSECGMEESVLVFLGAPIPLDQWAVMKNKE